MRTSTLKASGSCSACSRTDAITRVGGSEPVKLEARVVATINADYEAKIQSGELRRDLVAHFNILSVRVPPLRDYAEDVPELLTYYVDKLVDSEGLSFRRFSVAAQNRLRNYPWPDNVRELKNLVRRLLMADSDEDISLEEVEAEISSAGPVDEPLVKQDLLALPLREAREQFERAYLQQQLVLCDGKVGQLAKRVGMERTHLYRKLQIPRRRLQIGNLRRLTDAAQVVRTPDRGIHLGHGSNRFDLLSLEEHPERP